jgi:hypothetical protein
MDEINQNDVFNENMLNHYLNMLVTRCIKVIMPSKPVFGGYIEEVSGSTRANISSKHRLL